MIFQGFNSSEFYLRTNMLQEQCIACAIKQADQILRSEPPRFVNVTARKLSQKAYAIFEQEMKAEFPSPSYSNILDLTVTSRDKLFLCELKDRLVNIFNTKQNSSEGRSPEVASF